MCPSLWSKPVRTSVWHKCSLDSSQAGEGKEQISLGGILHSRRTEKKFNYDTVSVMHISSVLLVISAYFCSSKDRTNFCLLPCNIYELWVLGHI